MIPRIIHRIWIGDPEPAWIARYADTWRDLHPGWDLWQWDDLAVSRLDPPLVNDDLYRRAHEIAPRNVGQLRSDVLRYELLYRHGGLYVDADFEALRPIDDLLDEQTAVATWERQGEQIANGLLAFAPGHPFLAALIAGLPDSIRSKPKARPAETTGPRYLTRMWRKHRRPMTVLPERLFYPYSVHEATATDVDDDWPEGCYAVHHWHNRRRTRGALPCLD